MRRISQSRPPAARHPRRGHKINLMKITFSVIGVPAPGGSKVAMPIYGKDGRAVTTLTEGGKYRPVLRYVDMGGKRNTEWRAAVGWAGKAAMQKARMQPLPEALRLTIEFIMHRPQKLIRARHTIAPDLTKLARSTEDALTDIVWVDDSQIVQQVLSKRYAELAEHSGATITIETLDEIEQALPLQETKAPVAAISAQKPEMIDSPFD